MGMTENAHDALVTRIAQIIDHPSVYMGGPSRNSLRIATEIVKHHRADLCASGQQVRALVDQAASIFTHCSVTDGVCCCGDNMEGHSHPMSAGHRPVDHGSYMADQWLEAYAALTPAPQPDTCWRCGGTGLALNYAGEPGLCSTCKGDTVTVPQATTPTAQEAVPTCFACEDNPKHPNIPCAVCGAHPPQPSETVAEAEIERLTFALAEVEALELQHGAVIARLAEENRRLREALKKIASTGRCEFAEVRAVLRTLKGGKA